MDAADILKETEKYGFVSFDVFDTLLLRPYVSPVDLFHHMESHFRRPGFATERIRAERTSRSKEFEEVTLDEIYDGIDGRFKDLKDSELLFERQVLLPNPEMKAVFDEVKKSGKRILLLSDMYLPSVFLSEVLGKNGFEGYEHLYVSCEHRKSKHSGELFLLALKDLGIGPKDVVHIGDGDVSDVKTPSKMGIRALKYPKVIDRYFSEHKREYRYYRRNRSLGRSVTVAMDALHSMNVPKDNFWYEIGYRYGGPVNSAFATFIERTADKDGVLLFVARDGYNARRAYDIMYGDVENHYVYAVRTFNILFGRVVIVKVDRLSGAVDATYPSFAGCHQEFRQVYGGKAQERPVSVVESGGPAVRSGIEQCEVYAGRLLSGGGADKLLGRELLRSSVYHVDVFFGTGVFFDVTAVFLEFYVHKGF